MNHHDLTSLHSAPPFSIVIFGASGDLAYRKLVPALFALYCSDLLPQDFVILGAARSPYDETSIRQRFHEGIEKFGRFKPSECANWEDFISHIFYQQLHYDHPDDFPKLGERLKSLEKEYGVTPNRLFYLAIPPGLYGAVAENLGAAGLAQQHPDGFARIIIEKPFGTDTKSAEELNRRIHQVFSEDQVYRIDHYLGKETVQNLLVFRFANAIFEPLWNRHYVDHVQISVLESVAVGHRGGYYDQAGVMRDMFQNHLMQLLALTAMEPPNAWDATQLRDEKVKVLRAVRPPTSPGALRTNTVRAQYRSQDGSGPTYRLEPGVDPKSETPTYAALTLFIDNWRWQGVPFYLRSGKALAGKTTEIFIQFREVPHLLFNSEGADLAPNALSICLQPHEGFHLRFQAKSPGAGMRTRDVNMRFHFSSAFGEKALPLAYERLLLDAILGDASLFSREDEIMASWHLIDGILQGWESGEGPPLTFYEPGSWGPTAADNLLSANGRAWSIDCYTDNIIED